jgi:hypothetical protein
MNNAPDEMNEYIAVVTSGELFKFCKEQDLPFLQAFELSLREDLTDFQFGFLVAYSRLLTALVK